MFQKAHDLVTQASQDKNKNELEISIQFSRSTKQRHPIFTAMKKVDYYVRGLKSSNRKEILEELRRLPPNRRSNLKDTRRIAAAKAHSQRVLMEHA